MNTKESDSLINDVREYIQNLKREYYEAPEIQVEPQVEPHVESPQHSPHKPSLDFQILERRQKQVLKKYKRPPGYSEATLTNVLETETELQSQTRFQHPWKQLPKGLKMNRIKAFLSHLQRKFKWSGEDHQKAEKLICFKIDLISNHDIVYDDKKGRITNMPSLTFHQTPQGLHFTWKKIIKKASK